METLAVILGLTVQTLQLPRSGQKAAAAALTAMRPAARQRLASEQPNSLAVTAVTARVPLAQVVVVVQQDTLVMVEARQGLRAQAAVRAVLVPGGKMALAPVDRHRVLLMVPLGGRQGKQVLAQGLVALLVVKQVATVQMAQVQVEGTLALLERAVLAAPASNTPQPTHGMEPHIPARHQQVAPAVAGAVVAEQARQPILPGAQVALMVAAAAAL
jgi:hypothetical protein